MKLKEERSNSKEKIPQKKFNDTMEKNNNPIFPIKYLCFNEVKKIVNNKNKKSPVTNKNNENIKITNRIKKEEEDDYNQIIYNKRVKINRNLSYTNLNINKLINNYKNENMNKCNSTDERYKIVKMFGLYTKKIFYGSRIINSTMRSSIMVIKKCRFSKKNGKKKKYRNKIKMNNNNYINVNEIANSNNNIIFRTNNINESNNTITSNTITSKTITNNTMSNYTMSNVTNNSNNNKKNINTNPNINKKIPNKKEYKTQIQENKINNIKIVRNKGRNNNLNLNINKNINKQNKKNKENENIVFVRRIILEEKFTIDSKGDKKTIYIKKISPIIKTNEIMNSADKRLRNKKINRNINDKDNTYINHNDINLNFNVCSFQKINLNNSYQKNRLLSLNQKMDSFDEDNNKGINVNNSINDTILRNYKDFLNIKKCNKIIYHKPNGISYKLENNHKSYQSLFPSPNRKYLIQLSESDLDNKNNNLYDGKNKNHHQELKKLSKNMKHNSPLNYILSYPRCLKNKMVHRKTKTNFIIPKEENENILTPKEGKESFTNKRSLSFVGKIYMQNMVKKIKKGRKIELKDKIKNINTPTPQDSSKNRQNKINDYLYFPIPNNEKNKIKKINSNRNNKNCKNLKKLNICNKPNIQVKNKDENNNNNNSIRSHSMSKIKVKNNFSSNEIKLFLNYLRNNLIISERNKSHRNFIIKKKEKYNFNNNKSKSNYSSTNNSLSNRPNYSNLIYFKSKDRDKLMNY